MIKNSEKKLTVMSKEPYIKLSGKFLIMISMISEPNGNLTGALQTR